MTPDKDDAVRALHAATHDFVTWWDRWQESTNEESRAFAYETLRDRAEKLKAAKAAVQPLFASGAK